MTAGLAALTERVNELQSGDIPLLAKEGWPRHQEDGPVPTSRGRGGRSQDMFRNPFSTLCVSDHPVCGASVGFADFLLVPQPPLLCKEGNVA